MPPRSTPGPTLVIGVAGGIASGKSVVARGLAGDEEAVIRADALAHEVLASEEVTRLVRARFGDEVLAPDGTPDRAKLAARMGR